MCDILCVTNRLLCQEPFPVRVERVAKAGPRGIILREKDLSEAEYQVLAGQVLEICRRYGVSCILHSFVSAAIALGCPAIHLPLSRLRTLTDTEKQAFSVLGASCHSASEAMEAQELGCSYITAGHVFETACKAGLPGRGLSFLEEVAARVSIPVYAIGGISADNIAAVRSAGAAGGCVMSALMTCADPADFLGNMRRKAE